MSDSYRQLSADGCAAGLRRAVLSQLQGEGAEQAHVLHSLRETLSKFRKAVDIGHRAITKAWHGPLSLFGEREEREAAQRGVPAWALENARAARHLAEIAAEQLNLSECYEAQLCIPLSKLFSSKGKIDTSDMVLQDPVLTLVKWMEETASCLKCNLSAVEQTRDAFDRAGVDNEAKISPMCSVPQTANLPLYILSQVDEPHECVHEEVLVTDVMQSSSSFTGSLRLTLLGVFGYPVSFDGVREEHSQQDDYLPPGLP